MMNIPKFSATFRIDNEPVISAADLRHRSRQPFETPMSRAFVGMLADDSRAARLMGISDSVEIRLRHAAEVPGKPAAYELSASVVVPLQDDRGHSNHPLTYTWQFRDMDYLGTKQGAAVLDRVIQKASVFSDMFRLAQDASV